MDDTLTSRITLALHDANISTCLSCSPYTSSHMYLQSNFVAVVVSESLSLPLSFLLRSTIYNYKCMIYFQDCDSYSHARSNALHVKISFLLSLMLIIIIIIFFFFWRCNSLSIWYDFKQKQNKPGEQKTKLAHHLW